MASRSIKHVYRTTTALNVCSECAGRGGGGQAGEAEGLNPLHRGSIASHRHTQSKSSGEDDGGEGQVTGGD